MKKSLARWVEVTLSNKELFVCQSCGTKYSPEAKKLIIGGP